MTQYKNKYRIETNRLKHWDYSSDGYYFLTICTRNRIQWFGEIDNGEMVLSDFGKIVNEQWVQSFEIRDELSKGEFIVMPNHIHGIVVLENDSTDTTGTGTGTVETHGRASLPHRKPKSISSFMAGFKSATIREIDKFNRQNPLWQHNYWDRIIRHEKEYQRIAEYIKNNPINWENDSLYGLIPEGIKIVEGETK